MVGRALASGMLHCYSITGVKNGKVEGDPRGDVSESEAATEHVKWTVRPVTVLCLAFVIAVAWKDLGLKT